MRNFTLVLVVAIVASFLYGCHCHDTDDESDDEYISDELDAGPPPLVESDEDNDPGPPPLSSLPVPGVPLHWPLPASTYPSAAEESLTPEARAELAHVFHVGAPCPPFSHQGLFHGHWSFFITTMTITTVTHPKCYVTGR